MDHFPAFLNVRGRKAVVIGGGNVASRKAAMLARAGARVTIIAPELSAHQSDELSTHEYNHLAEEFTDEHLTGAMLVIAATNNPDVNRQVARVGRLRSIPVNVVDDPELSSFIIPAIVDRSPVTVAISTGGASPVLARWIKTRIETALPSTLGRMATLAGIMRRVVATRIPDITSRRRFWEKWIDEGDSTAVSIYRALNHRDREDGQVWLVGAGPGDPDLLTIKALRALQSADVIVHDRLVSDEILDLARRDADQIYVGKQAGNHAMTQHEINNLLIRLARDGKRVVRLKGGDPFMFGRGGEEMVVLRDTNVICHVVPGITAAAGCAAQSGIPLTHRDYAQSCVFATGHGKDGLPDLDWPALARTRQTLVIYMGLGNLGLISDRLREHGLSPATPAAVISNGSTPHARTITGTLSDLAQKARTADIASPALLIIGDVVGLAHGETSSHFMATENAA